MVVKYRVSRQLLPKYHRQSIKLNVLSLKKKDEVTLLEEGRFSHFACRKSRKP